MNLHLDVKDNNYVHSSAVEHMKQHRPQIRWTPCIREKQNVEKHGGCVFFLLFTVKYARDLMKTSGDTIVLSIQKSPFQNLNTTT